MPISKSARIKKSRVKKLRKFYLLSVAIGCCCLIIGLLLILKFNQPTLAQTNILNQNSPVRIMIPKIRLNLPIVEAELNNNQWQISETQANHLNSSANPKEFNNIVIYGHNKWEILGKLTQVNLGTEIDIKTLNGSIYTYVVFDKKEVNQYAVGFIKPTNMDMLTLFTCSGWFDSKRLLIQALPKK